MVGMKLRVRVRVRKAIQLSDEGNVEWLCMFNVCMC